MQHYSLFAASFSFAQQTQYLNWTLGRLLPNILNIEQGRLEMRKTGTSPPTLPDIGIGEHFEERK